VTPPVALTIAGTDSGGGAGIAADLRTFAAHRVFGALAVTAVTAQDTTAVHRVVALDPAEVEAQIDAVLGDLPVRAAKTGMLATVEILERLVERAEAGRLPPLVVDPVLVAASGAALFEGDPAPAYRRLVARAAVVTPNLPEAEALLGRPVRDRRAMADAARRLVDLGAGLALVKGGHLPGDVALDVAFDGRDLVELAERRVDTPNVHGTGCTLSAAIAARLALGEGALDAVAGAKRYVTQALAAAASWRLGAGPGPVDHGVDPPAAQGARPSRRAGAP